MVKQTFNLDGVAVSAVPDLTAPVPWSLRLAYAWKCLKGQAHVYGPIDVSNVKSEGYMDGNIRVYLSDREVQNYFVRGQVGPR